MAKKQKGGETMSQQINKLVEILDQLAAAGVPLQYASLVTATAVALGAITPQQEQALLGGYNPAE